MKHPAVASSPTPFDALAQRLPGSTDRARWWACGAVGVIAALGAGSTGTYAAWNARQVVAPGVLVAGTPIGNLSRDQAIQTLEKRFGETTISLVAGEKTHVFALEQVGGEPQIEKTVAKALRVGRDGWLGGNVWRLMTGSRQEQRFGLPIDWKRGALTSQLKVAARSYDVAARDARLRWSGTGLEAEEAQTGRAIDISQTADRIAKTYWIGMAQPIAAVVTTTQPRVTADRLVGTDRKIGSYLTRFNPGLRGRTTNVRIAARQVDGTVLMPGEEFSFNRATGERTWSKGYRMAHIFERKPGAEQSEIVDGLAGGVCQVSSTLYNAVRKADHALPQGRDITIVERSSHSLPVTYVPVGLDATVAWPHTDFRFRNTLENPIFLRAQVSGSRLNIEVWERVPLAGSIS